MIKTTIRAVLLILAPYSGLSAQGPIGSPTTAGTSEPDPLLTSTGPVVSVGLLLGYTAGFGFQVSGQVGDFAKGFPLEARLLLGYASVAPGSAPAARQIFINNATNGTPSKSGQTLELGLDLLYPVRLFSLDRSYFVGSVTHASFKANFKYVGGNEDFDVTSSHFGLGAGLESYFPMNGRTDFVVASGLDYFFSSRLTGHDTSYGPGGDDVNPREDFTYSDADSAIGQPKLRFRLMIGFSYRI